MLRALVFDFDGLLVDTETVLIDAWVSLHEEDGIACERAYLHGVVGHVGIDCDLWAAYSPEADRTALDTRYRTTARRLTLAAPPLPGVLALLEAARAAGLKLAVASNSTHTHVEGHLEHRGMRGFFQHIACRDDVARGKPEPDVYLAALRGLGVEAGEAVAFEDSVPGHIAAHRAGLPVVVIPNPSTAHCDFPHAARKLGSMDEITVENLAALTASESRTA